LCTTTKGVAVRNPAFDVTPSRFVAAIVCERGVARPPFAESLRALAAVPAGAPIAAPAAVRHG
jgi:methylthioribose-1-phosphate isomerase